MFTPIYTENQNWIHLSDTIGSFPRLIEVPRHFFKVIRGIKYVKVNNNKDSLQQVILGAFLIPNNPVDINVF